MAMDSAQKRHSALNVNAPWRGAFVAAAEAAFSVGNRMAAAYSYSGISADSGVYLVFDIEALQLFSPGMVMGAGEVVPL